ESFGHALFRVDVELEPLRAGSGFGDLLDGAARHRAEHHNSAAGSGCSGGGELAVGVDGALEGHGRKEHREWEGLAEDSSRGVDAGDIDERTRQQLDALERLAVSGQGKLIL